MSMNWALALLALVTWVFAFGWYIIGIGRVGETFSRLWAATLQRLGMSKTPR